MLMSRDPSFLRWKSVSRNGNLPSTSCSTVKVMVGRRLLRSFRNPLTFVFIIYHAGVINVASPDSGWVCNHPEC